MPFGIGVPELLVLLVVLMVLVLVVRAILR
jgi:hypothetical protein